MLGERLSEGEVVVAVALLPFYLAPLVADDQRCG